MNKKRILAIVIPVLLFALLLGYLRNNPARKIGVETVLRTGLPDAGRSPMESEAEDPEPNKDRLVKPGHVEGTESVAAKTIQPPVAPAASGAGASPTPATDRLSRFRNEADSYVLPVATLDAIKNASVGQKIDLPGESDTKREAIAGVVFMAESPGAEDGEFRALKVEDLDGAVLTVTYEAPGKVSAILLSPDSATAWTGKTERSEPVSMKRVPRSKILPDCDAPAMESEPEIAEAGEMSVVSTDLNSRPGSARVLYLDFDGETVSGTEWNARYTGGGAIVASSAGLSANSIEQIWNEVSEDFRPFDVNVTTSRAVYNATPVANRMMIVLTRSDAWFGRRAGGVAYLGSFGTSFQRVCWGFTHRVGGATNVAMMVSHEFGHTLSLHHWGDTGRQYHPGVGYYGSPTSWGPLMGAPYRMSVVHWTRGEYARSVNESGGAQDDVTIIRNRLGGLSDEDASTRASARTLRSSTSGDTSVSHRLSGGGLIGSSSDADYFFYDATSQGLLHVTVQPFMSSENGEGTNLDVQVKILNATGTALQTANPQGTTNVTTSFPITSPGRYYIEIDGVGKLTSDGYSDYGSIGSYVVGGSFNFSTAPVIVDPPISVTQPAGRSIVLSVAAFGASPLSYQWQRRPGTSGAWTNIGTNQAIFAIASPVAGDSGQYRVIVSNSSGPSATSAVATVKVNPPPPQNSIYYWSHHVGAPGGRGTADGLGVDAGFNGPGGIARAADGTIYISDTSNNTIRKVVSGRIVSTFAGSAGQSASVDGSGALARFRSPRGIAIDAQGNVFVADSSDHTIRRITPSGVVTTFAGASGQPGSTNGLGTASRFNGPRGLAFNAAGDLFVADQSNSVIRRITPSGIVTTFAGSPGVADHVDGSAGVARFDQPNGLAFDGNGDLFVTDSGSETVRRITPSGQVSTVAGSPYVWGSTDGTGPVARFGSPYGIALGPDGNFYVVEGFNLIRKVTPSGVVTTVAGTVGLPAVWSDGTGPTARFNVPRGICQDGNGGMLVADTGNHVIRRLRLDGFCSTVMGRPPQPGGIDGIGLSARFDSPFGLTMDGTGNLFACDQGNSTIRLVTPEGVVSTFAGTAGANGSTNGTGSVARFFGPFGIARRIGGDFFVADTFNYTIRRITPSAAVTTFAGTAGSLGTTDGTGAAARFSEPAGIAVLNDGTVFVSDKFSATIRKITSAGVVSTFAGAPNQFGTTNGVGNAARFGSPRDIVVDSSGNLFVADQPNHTIWRITPDGTVSTFAGSAGVAGSTDGTGTAARFRDPIGLAIDSEDNLYVADYGNRSVRKISPTRSVVTIGGTSGVPGWTEGVGTVAKFGRVMGIAVAVDGTVYVSVSDQHCILKGEPPNLRGLTSSGSAMAGAVLEDTDGDGSSDIDETIAGTDPVNPSSFLRFESIELVPGTDAVNFRFEAVPGRVYQIEHSSDLRDWDVIVDDLTVEEGEGVLETSATVPLTESSFFRIGVKQY